ncbi:uncharacterized protein C8Q71DRAFT_863650 [Rhodofomes roseus]|uniref:Aminoglycoside phosphotransferase domain-containing protein n=1 Tax=Rhodofomes roseus TaxID=34475 RepID=A0ABQ8JY70_9APHY|nr:uncharacterized protein C8Q71DRAFT_863650 [Rhodofomes roseus]KAH9828974.1 hypothetical protein C8Q71DRAFT_863650 [Rhodofomes roseus]
MDSDAVAEIQMSSARIPSEAALNESYRPGYTRLCPVDVPRLVDVARAALRLDPSTIPTGLRILAAVVFNKVFFMQFGSIAVIARVPFNTPAAHDPVRLRSQIATLDFLSIHKPTVPVPKVLAASPDSQSPPCAPYVIAEFCKGTPLTIQEWYRDMSAASRDRAIDLLADMWVKITAPLPFKAIGSIIRRTVDPHSAMSRMGGAAESPAFHIMPMIPQFPKKWTELVDPSAETRAGPRSIAEHWAARMKEQRDDIVATFPDEDHSVLVCDNVGSKHTLGKLWQCVRAMQELTDIAVSLDPLAHAPAMALMHADYSCWRNILFSPDRARIEGVIDWDDAIVVPRDLAALYPEELTHHTRGWRVDPPDVFAIPPGTLYEDEGLWETAIEETKQRRMFRKAVGRRDPQLAELYTDRRARLRRRVDILLRDGWYAWLSRNDWVLGQGLEEARALAS